MAIPIINVSILNGSNGFRLDGVAASDQSGISISNAGDVNGDGFDDVIVGASSADPNGERSGSSYVLFGKAGDFDAAMNLSGLDGSNGFRLDGGAAFDDSGISVSSAGDVNGDGFDDLVVGAPGADPNGERSGSSYVVFGKASGFSAAMNLSSLDGSNGFRVDGARSVTTGNPVSSVGDINGDGFSDVTIGDGVGYNYVVFGKSSNFSAAINLSTLDGNNGFRLDGVDNSYNSSNSISDAGDVNGDGFDDLIVGSPYGGLYYSGYSGPFFSGTSYVVFGKASGFSATLDVSGLDGSNGFSLSGGRTRDESGSSVSIAGDINGDGFDDVIIGTSGIYGYSYVVFGKAAGFNASLDLATLDGDNGFRLEGSGNSVNNAGDFNRDGFDDLIIGSYVVFGKSTGFGSRLDLSKLDGNNGFRLEGGASNDDRLNQINSAGDVNDDGFDDLIASAPGADSNGDSSGSSYVIFGGDFFNEAVYLGTPGDDNLEGTSLAERFEAGGGNDRMTGLGGADVFHGGAGDDTIAVPDLDFQWVDGGIGNDTLELTTYSNINLADFHDTVDGIETIDLTGSGHNILTLTLPDLLSLSDTTDTFTVNGDTGDRVNGLKDGWADGGFDGNYHIYTNQGTVLRVDTSVSTDRPNAGVINLADLDGSNGFRLGGMVGGVRSGRSVSDAGDVNGDGFDDVIIGANNLSYVVFGKAVGFGATLDLSNLNGSNGFRLNGFSYSVSSAGDVNGDGFDDVIIGTPDTEPNGNRSGSSYVVFGKASGFDATLDLSSLNGNNGFSLNGVAAYDLSGFSVSNAGDVNGDGFDDVIVGAPYAGPNDTNSDSNYVIFGKSSGFDAAMSLSSLNGSNGFTLDDGGGAAGFSVNSAGDVNGDGFADLIVGDPFGNQNGNSFEYSYVVFGKNSGFSAKLELLSLDGNNGFRLDGVAGGDGLGHSVSGAGDVNGDGFSDLIVGAFRADQNGNNSGSSYVVFGKAFGFDATFDLSTLNDSNGFRLDGTESYDYSGFSVSTAGDVNGDGFDDVIVGAYGADPNGSSIAGSTYVVFGKASGFSAAMDLSGLDGNNGFRLDGTESFDYSGFSVSTAGDVNGDGFDDLIVGAPNANANGSGSGSGSSYVIFGRSNFGGDNVIAGTSGNDVLKGTSDAEIFEASDGNDKMIGRGGADVFHGGAGDDYIQVADLGFGSVDGGTGNDVLHLAGNGLNLNLADVGANISGIETLCLFGKGDNTLTLTAEDLLNLSDTSNTLRVNGNAAGHVIVEDGGWVDGGLRGSGYYHVYTNDDAVLLVGQNVTVDFA